MVAADGGGCSTEGYARIYLGRCMVLEVTESGRQCGRGDHHEVENCE